MNNLNLLTKKNIIFDLDGTIINLKKSTIKACFYALSKIYNEIPKIITKNRISKLVGRPFTQDLAILLEWDNKTTHKFTKYYIEGKEKFACQNKLTKNIIKMLNSLQTNGKELYLVTNKTRSETNRLISSFGLKKYFSKIICRGDDNFANKTEMIKSLNLDLNDIIIYGNMQNDIVKGATFIRSTATYGNALIQTIKSFISNYCFIIPNIFSTPLKYKLDGFT